jgi:hypothetical protein
MFKLPDKFRLFALDRALLGMEDHLVNGEDREDYDNLKKAADDTTKKLAAITIANIFIKSFPDMINQIV